MILSKDYVVVMCTFPIVTSFSHSVLQMEGSCKVIEILLTGADGSIFKQTI